jgi:hypothetical protein
VVVGTELGVPPGGMLSYVLNDEQAGGGWLHSALAAFSTVKALLPF